MSGTSMASPAVAGLVALCEGENGAHGPCWGQPPANVRAILLAAANTAAAAAPGSVFNGSPARPVSGRFYGALASASFPSAAGVAPSVTTAPAVTGTASTTATLSASAGTWAGATPIATALQWVRCTTTSLASCSDVAGATAATYTPVAADVARYLRIRVIATNAEGAAMTRSAPTALVTTPIAPASTAAPALSGYAILTHTLSGKNGSWSGTAPITYAMQWVRCTSPTVVATCAAIAGATALTYPPVSADVGKYLRFTVAATNAKATVVARSAATVAVTNAPAPVLTAMVNTVLPSLLGNPTVTHTLSFNNGTWKGSSPSYSSQWQRCTTTGTASCLNIPGATASGYLLQTADRGKYLRIAVTGTNSKGAVTARSNPMGPVK
jgi:hypothetical protein